MRIGMSLNYAGGFAETVAELGDYEKAGLDIVFVPEAYSFDAVSQLGFTAARTRRRIRIVVAALGPKNVELAAELAEGWEPIFYFPEKAQQAWGAPLAAGRAKRDPTLPPLDVVAQAPLAIGDDVAGYLELGRPFVALYIGGEGPPPGKGAKLYYKLAGGGGVSGAGHPPPGAHPGARHRP